MLDVAVWVNDTGATYSTFLSVTFRPEFFGMIELGARVRSERRLLIVRKLGGRVSFFFSLSTRPLRRTTQFVDLITGLSPWKSLIDNTRGSASLKQWKTDQPP